MVTEDQADVTACLASPGTHGGQPVERIETHSAVVFLAGDRAWKLKKAVRFDYLDFSTADARRRACEAELAVNRRTAPSLYLAVRPVTRDVGGRLALDGDGDPVDWVLEMRRFEQAQLLDQLAVDGALDVPTCRRLARQVAAFHASARPRPDQGDAASLAWVIDGNARGLAAEGAFLPGRVRAALTEGAQAQLRQETARIESRRCAGFVRECHGDLHLRNIVLEGGVPTLFDAIEFNSRLSCVDVWYDLAFLLMDLWHRGMRAHAHATFGTYLEATGDVDGVALLPLFLSCRAAVKAKTEATVAQTCDDPERQGRLRESSASYLDLALTVLQPPSPRLLAIGGLSGTGKSTVAAQLAPGLGAVPGAVHLRSDVERKRLFGLAPASRLGPQGYTPEVSRRVYATLAEQARRVLATGHQVIVDAVCGSSEERALLRRTATDAGARFAGIWLETGPATRLARVERRSDDASDADADVARRQTASVPADWWRVDAAGAVDVVAGRVRACLDGA